jgi:hypothetical protein
MFEREVATDECEDGFVGESSGIYVRSDCSSDVEESHCDLPVLCAAI